MKQTLRFPRLKDAAEGEGGATLAKIEKVVSGLNGKQKRKRHKEGDQSGISLLSSSVFSTPSVYVSSGILPLDCSVCFGLGFPVGIVEIFGPEATAKSAILEHTLAESQKRGYFTGLFPMEYSVDMRRAVSVGINPRKLIIFDDCETIEDVYHDIKKTVKKIRSVDKTTPIVLGWDTIAATPTRSELKSDKELDASDMGKFAQQMSKLFRRLVKFLKVNMVCLICINQTRTNLGKMWGNKETTAGGKALKFYAWVRCRIRQKEIIKDKGGEEVGMMCQLKVVKNKVGLRPLLECKIPVYFGKGIDNTRAVWEYAVDNDIVHRKGTHYRYHGQVITRKSFAKFYEQNKEKFEKRLRKHAQGRD